MNTAELTEDNRAILKCLRLDYFWSSIPFDRLYTALDVGAHIGLWSHVCREYAPHMMLMAIEPHPDNYQRLIQNVPEVAAVMGYCGYHDAPGLCCRPKMEGSHYLLKAGEQPAQGSYTLSQLTRYTLEDFGAIDLLKLDCEGSEFDIIQHCAPETLQRIQVIVGEYHLERGDLWTMVDRLKAFDFDLTIIPHPDAPHLGHFLAKKADA